MELLQSGHEWRPIIIGLAFGGYTPAVSDEDRLRTKEAIADRALWEADPEFAMSLGIVDPPAVVWAVPPPPPPPPRLDPGREIR